jgi:hypothetical protein
MLFEGKWVEIEKIILLREINQAEKDSMFLLICRI